MTVGKEVEAWRQDWRATYPANHLSRSRASKAVQTGCAARSPSVPTKLMTRGDLLERLEEELDLPLPPQMPATVVAPKSMIGQHELVLRDADDAPKQDADTVTFSDAWSDLHLRCAGRMMAVGVGAVLRGLDHAESRWPRSSGRHRRVHEYRSGIKSVACEGAGRRRRRAPDQVGSVLTRARPASTWAHPIVRSPSW